MAMRQFYNGIMYLMVLMAMLFVVLILVDVPQAKAQYYRYDSCYKQFKEPWCYPNYWYPRSTYDRYPYFYPRHRDYYRGYRIQRPYHYPRHYRKRWK